MHEQRDPNMTTDLPSAPADSSRAADPLRATDDVRGAASTKESPPDADAQGGNFPMVPGYRVLREIARGGMGRVLAAYDLTLYREVALKVLLPGANADRFVRESKITAQLPHPGIPPVHALGVLADGSPFLAMKLIAGRTLADEMKAADRPRLVQAFLQVCQAVGFAHSRGVIHRDLKPANIMVGAFGEVQVMDWGLAKVLRDEGSVVGDEQRELPDSSPMPPPSSLLPHRSSLTQAGTVLGTPAYMAPEQARCDTPQLDERVDVFGLGAILCKILTGEPPFRNQGRLDIWLQASAGDLSDAFSRIDKCGADAELLTLAKSCLAPRKEDRPRHAGQVAEVVQRYEQLVQERLRQAELEREKAQVQANEERKHREVEQARVQAERRRLRAQRNLAAAVVVFLLALAVAGAWFVAERARQAQRQQYVNAEAVASLRTAVAQRKALHNTLRQPLRAHALLSNLTGWQTALTAARASWQQAQKLVESDPELVEPEIHDRLKQVGEQLEADQSDFKLARTFDKIRQEASLWVEGRFNYVAARRSYEEAFQEAGLQIRAGDPATLAGQVRQSPIRLAWVAALDHWAEILQGRPIAAADRELHVRLLEVARLADPDSWRGQVRDPSAPLQALRQLADEVDPSRQPPQVQQSPQILLLLASRLQDRARAEKLLRRAVLAYPQDFWLHFTLGNTTQTPLAKTGFYQAALAARPHSSAAHTNWGVTLYDQQDLDGALAHYQKALEIDPKHAAAHNNWGNVLAAKQDYDGAIEHYEKALELDPRHASAHNNLGSALALKRQYDKAIAHFRQSLDLNPWSAQAENNWGNALQSLKDFDGAIDHYEKSLKLNPQYADAHYNWGLTLARKLDYDGAIEQFRLAVAANPKLARAHSDWALVLRIKGDDAGAIEHCQLALQLHPQLPAAHVTWGDVLHAQKDYQGAADHFETALQLNPKLAGTLRSKLVHAHANRGNILRAKRDFKGSIDHYRKALEFDPSLALVQAYWGAALEGLRDYNGAMDHYQQALRLDANLAQAYHGWGNVLKAQQDYPGAIKQYQKALAIDPKYAPAHGALGGALLQQGEFHLAEESTRRALELMQPGDPQRTLAKNQIKRCQQLLELERRADLVADGQAKPSTAAELLELARFCRKYHKHHAAARLYAAAFAAVAASAENQAPPDRYHAACSAARAAAGQGRDAGKFDDQEKARLRKQALDWLRADLALRTKQLESSQPAERTGAQNTMRQWQKDSDLSGLRDKDALAKLPAEERVACETLWTDVAALLKKAETPAGNEGK
jgi:tetratricopeptide (TPR) repeat protein